MVSARGLGDACGFPGLTGDATCPDPVDQLSCCKKRRLLRNPYLYLMAGIFLLAMDFWNWGKVQPAFWGIPALQTLAMYRLVKS
jgi:hypothetical protein